MRQCNTWEITEKEMAMEADHKGNQLDVTWHE